VAIVDDGWGRKHREAVLFVLGVSVVVSGVGRWIVTGDPYAQIIVGAGLAILGVLPAIQRGGK
jgi:hypothetical protein